MADAASPRFTFILIHGAWQGAWAWETIVPRLKAQGHDAIAADLPDNGHNPMAPAEVNLERYAAHVAGIIDATKGPIVMRTEPGLESTQYFGPPMGATANGVHAAIIEVDPQTFDLQILKYVVVHDCGTVINPMILAGQIHGGVAQGIGNAFYEKLSFDDQGQLLNASLADYLLPTALEVPRMELDHTTTPSPLNPLGIKGAEEAGAIPVGPLFAQAIEDALDLKRKEIELLEIPLSPSRLFELTRKASKT